MPYYLLWLVCLIVDFTCGFSFVFPEFYESLEASYRLTRCDRTRDDYLFTVASQALLPLRRKHIMSFPSIYTIIITTQID